MLVIVLGCRHLLSCQSGHLQTSVLPMTSASDAFAAKLKEHGLHLNRAAPRVLQLNVGKRCNLTCLHCHVNAGPKRKEMMTRSTLDRIIAWQERARLPVVDLTGGAPEMLPDFRYLVVRLRELDPAARIIDRCNLTIFFEPGYENLADFLAQQRIEIVASLPCYSAENVDEQRGSGVFDKSIQGLRQLNALGYGTDPQLPLHLVYNPNGAYLPRPQIQLEADYKRELSRKFGITFNQLFTLTNLPISRFASWLKRQGEYEAYLELLSNSFNPATVDGLMCRDTVNVDWRGEIFDCDFNQMLGMRAGVTGDRTHYLWDLDPRTLNGAVIRTAKHCFGCTAGAGSSCGGAIEGVETARAS